MAKSTKTEPAYGVAIDFNTDEPLVAILGEGNYVAIMLKAKPVGKDPQKWAIGRSDAHDGPWEIDEDTFSKTMNKPFTVYWQESQQVIADLMDAVEDKPKATKRKSSRQAA